MKHTTTLRKLIQRSGALMAPGVADALNARLVRRHGFEAIYMTGAGTTAVRLGMPDVGLLTMTEMVDNAARIADASGLPLIADADNGYGGVLNVRRTVQAYERAGAATVHIEDQVLPKRCGHLSGKQLVPVEEMEAKIRAATDARTDEDFVLIARTDAIAVEGFEPALERAAQMELELVLLAERRQHAEVQHRAHLARQARPVPDVVPAVGVQQLGELLAELVDARHRLVDVARAQHLAPRLQARVVALLVLTLVHSHSPGG